MLKVCKVKIHSFSSFASNYNSYVVPTLQLPLQYNSVINQEEKRANFKSFQSVTEIFSETEKKKDLTILYL